MDPSNSKNAVHPCERNRPTDPTAILVLGMHRSGTSAIARMLNLCGADLGRTLLPPKADNEAGFWENTEFLALHEQFLAETGFQWHRFLTLAKGWEKTALARRFESNLASLIATQFGNGQLWLVKDPRLSLLAPMWLTTLKKLQVRPAFVIAVRHPDEVAASLQRRDGFSPAQSHLLWLQHLIEAERATREHQRVFVHYEHLLRDWRTQLARVGKRLGIQWPVSEQDYQAQIDAFISPDLRHEHATTSQQPLPDLVRRLYDIALDACANGEDSKPAFLSLAKDLDDTMQLVAPLQQIWTERLAHTLDQHQEEIARARGAIDSTSREIANAREVIAAKDQELANAREVIDAYAEQIRMAQQAHLARDLQEAESQRLLEEKDRALTAAMEAAAARQAELDTFSNNPADHEGGLDFLRQQRNDNQYAIDNLEEQVVMARKAHRARDITESVLLAHISALNHSRWFRLGRLLRILSKPPQYVPTPPTPEDPVAAQEDLAQPLRLNLDTPAKLDVVTGRLRFSGWCVHPTLRVMDLRLRAGATTSICQYRLERADVGAAMPDIPGSTFSGFEVLVDLPPGSWRLDFSAVLEDGSEVTTPCPHALRVRRLPLRSRAQSWVRSRAGFLNFGLHEAQRWIADNRRLPRPREFPQLLRMAREQHKLRATPASISCPTGFQIPQKQDAYAVWQDFNKFNVTARENLQRRLDEAGALPLLSVVMPVYNPPMEYLREAIGSVFAQVYTRWELCLADDASTAPGVREYLEQLSVLEPRVRLCLREANGNISLATNSAAQLAHGDFLVFLDQDDLLTPDALGEIALAASAQPDADILYSDDDKIDVDGRRFAPQFKPGWSPELLLSYMYFSHVFVVRRELYDRLGGMRAGFEGSQDYDFALRATEQARTIAHIPQVLYHWRVLPGSTAASGAAKPESFEAGRRAVAQAMQRRGIRAEASQPEWAVQARCGIFSVRFADHGPKVSIIVPTRNEVAVLQRCLDSLRKTTYDNWEVLIVDNESDDPETLRYLQSCGHRVERIANPQGRFNYAHINNRAAELADGDFLLFLNNDTEIVDPRWLSQMVGYAQLEGVGAVGARLLYPDKRIQHAGIVHGYYRGLAGPAFKLAPAWDNGYLSYARVTRNYSAVTAACMLTPRKVFLEVGGFDEANFEVAYNDVDYCYRLGDRGLRNVYCADAELLHHEGHSRGFLDRPQEIASFRQRYSGMRDPLYSPHLSLDDERFAIQPRRWRTGKPSPVRALMCAFNLNWEGAPYSQLELTLELKRQGFIDPVVYAPQDGPLRKAYEDAGITVHVFAHPLTGVSEVGPYDAALSQFGDFIKSTGAQVVYGNTLQTFYAIDAAFRLGLPSLWNPRESEPWQTYFNFLPAPLAVRALRCFEHPYRVIFVASSTRKVFEALNTRGNFTVIHNGLNLDRLRSEAQRFPRDVVRQELQLGADDIVILLPGTVCERKGQHDLARALALLPAEVASRTRTFIVGDRPSGYSIDMHKLVQALPAELRTRVFVVGETSDIVRYYQAADIFVCTSRIESFPRVVLEAMAFGLPVVSTRVFGIAEQVSENVNALLYEPGDVGTLVSHLVRVVGEDELRSRMTANSPHVLGTLNTFQEMANAYGTIFLEAALAGPPQVQPESP